MKILVLCLILTSSSAFAANSCPKLTGTYSCVGENQQTTSIVITQSISGDITTFNIDYGNGNIGVYNANDQGIVEGDFISRCTNDALVSTHSLNSSIYIGYYLNTQGELINEVSGFSVLCTKVK